MNDSLFMCYYIFITFILSCAVLLFTCLYRCFIILPDIVSSNNLMYGYLYIVRLSYVISLIYTDELRYQY